MNQKFAAVDFGTNTARLLIGEQSCGEIVTVHIERRIVRMGGGFTHEVGLSPEAQHRGIECLKLFSDIIRSNHISNIFAVATSAVRDARNGQEFVKQVQIETGIALNVIDGLQEGLLTLRGVLSGLSVRPKHVLLVDVGGGSTEFTYAVNGNAAFVKSLPMGVVRLTEGFVGTESMQGRVKTVMADLMTSFEDNQIKLTQDCILVGTAGSATTLAAISLKMEQYDRFKINNHMLAYDDIYSIYSTLLELDLEERLTIPGLEKGREDLIIAGTQIILETMKMLDFKTLVVSDYGLLEGLAISGDILG